MLLTILLSALGAAFGFALALLQKEVRRLKASNWAQQQINANNTANIGFNTENIGVLDVSGQTLIERVATNSERLDALHEEMHDLIVVIAHETYRVEKREP